MRPVDIGARLLGRLGWVAWTAVAIAVGIGAACDQSDLRTAALASRPTLAFASTESAAIAKVEVDSASTLLSWGGIVAPSLYREAVFVRAARTFAPGDSIKIGITVSLPSPPDTLRTVNTKWEYTTGVHPASYTGTWTALAAHTGLKAKKDSLYVRDSAFVVRPAAGITWSYRACGQTVKPPASPSAWICKAFTYTRPVPPTTPPDSVKIDSSGVKLARLFVTPGQMNLVSSTAACRAIAPSSVWKDAGQTVAVDACRARALTARGDTVVLNMVAVVCAYAQFQDRHWQVTSNSWGQQRCKNEFPAVQAGTVLGSNFAPGEPVGPGSVEYVNLDAIAARGGPAIQPGELRSFVVYERRDTVAVLAPDVAHPSHSL